MLEARIKELELQLVTANAAVTSLTSLNTGLNEQLVDAQSRNKKLKRTSRRDERDFKEQLATAQSKKL
ncbi:MAG: hypothetical protein JWM35_2314 [Verrucomicrobia bacterium]|nr:hypothetical protein [Verrucomicrobiota bacterium]